MGLFGSMKDNFSSAAAEKFIAQYIEKYGKLTNFKINSTEKKIVISVILKGEVSPIDIKIGEYILTSSGGKEYITAKSVSASREWLEMALNDYFKGKPIEIPSQYAGMIKKVL